MSYLPLAKSLVRLLVVLIIFTPHFAGAKVPASLEECKQYLTPGQPVPGSYEGLSKQAETSRGGNFSAMQPQFLSPHAERELAKLWKGESGPGLLQAMLPPGVSFISHQLRKAEGEGVVKVHQPGGDFLMLRVEMPFRGRTFAFNVTVTASFLVANLERSMRGEKLWLIGPEASAALDWGHGGGTKTTGGHTVDTIMNKLKKYRVASVGMDQPWHGEGVREWFDSDEDYFQFRAAFRKQFIHPDVPTILVGHSMGGLVADMAVRRSGEKDARFGVREAYAAAIALSYVPDPKPGGNFHEKTSEERVKELLQKEEQWMAKVNPDDLNLFAGLMEQDKVSALSGLFSSWLGMYSDWTLPENNGADYIPALYVMGAHDSLSVTNEDSIAKHIGSLPNAKHIYFTVGVSFRGDVELIGHLLFDHLSPVKDYSEANAVIREYLNKIDAGTAKSDVELFKSSILASHVRPEIYDYEPNNYPSTMVLMAYMYDKNFKSFLEARIATQKIDKREYFKAYGQREQLETYNVIRDFISEILVKRGREPLVAVGGKPGLRKGESPNDFTESFATDLKLWGNLLAFREYLSDLELTERQTTAQFQKMNEALQAVGKFNVAVEVINKNKSYDDAKKAAEIAKLELPKDEDGNDLSIEAARDYYNVGFSKRSRRFIPSTGPLKELATSLLKQHDDLVTQNKALENGVLALEAEVEEFTKKRDGLSRDLEKALKTASSKAIAQKLAEKEAMREALNEFDYKIRTVQERFLADILSQGLKFSVAFDNLPSDLQDLYTQSEAQSRKYQQMLREVEQLEHREAMSGNLGIEMQNMAKSLYGPTGIEAQLVAKQREASVERLKIQVLNKQMDKLDQQYSHDILPGLFTYEAYKPIDELRDAKSWREAKAVMEKVRAKFKRIFGDRTPPESIGLY